MKLSDDGYACPPSLECISGVIKRRKNARCTTLDADIGTDCTSNGNADCVSGNHEVCTTNLCVCDAGYTNNSDTCDPVDCGGVTDPANGATVLDLDGITTYEATATVTCDHGTSTTITCASTGSWPALPTCLAGCGDPPSAPAHATVALAVADTTGTAATATVTCDAGYEVSAGVATITCQAGGSWTDLPTCTAKGSTTVAWSLYVLLLLGVMTRLME